MTIQLTLFSGNPAIYRADLIDPPVPFLMLHVQDVLERPVKMIGDVGDLFIDRLDGIAG
jgi:hypothetical protein